MAFSEWVGNLARKINGVMTTPSQQATQLAEQLGENNPWRTRIGQMTGTPSDETLQQGTNWDQSKRNYDLDVNRYESTTVPVTPEMFAGADPKNQLAQALAQNPRRYAGNIVQGALNTDDQLKQQAVQDKAIQDIFTMSNDPEYRKRLSSTPEGQDQLKQIDLFAKNPRAFGLEDAFKAYTGGGQLAKSIADAQTAQQQLQTGKSEVQQLLERLSPGTEKEYLSSDLSNVKDVTALNILKEKVRNKVLLAQQQQEDLQYVQTNMPYVQGLFAKIPDSDPDKQKLFTAIKSSKNREEFNNVWNEAERHIPQPQAQPVNFKGIGLPPAWENLFTKNPNMATQENVIKAMNEIEDPLKRAQALANLKRTGLLNEKTIAETNKTYSDGDKGGKSGKGAKPSKLVQQLTGMYSTYVQQQKATTNLNPMGIQDWIKSQSWNDGQRTYTGTQMLQLFNQEMLTGVDTSGVPASKTRNPAVTKLVAKYGGVGKAIMAVGGDPNVSDEMKDLLVTRFNENSGTNWTFNDWTIAKRNGWSVPHRVKGKK
jgi:hypothetical protein